MQKSRKVLAALATPVAVVAAGAMVYQASYAAFTGTTSNTGNEWSTGSVNLTDDDSGSAMFQVQNLLPGQSQSKCIRVTANASVPSTVKGYTVTPVKSAKGLEQHIDISIESGDGGSFANCTGFTPDGVTSIPDTPMSLLMAGATDWSNAMGAWAVAGTGPESKTYRISYKFDTAGLTQGEIDALQGSRVGVGIQWEMRSNDAS